MIKADAYGHGLLPVAGAVEDLVDGLCVFDTADGVTLRKKGINLPILVMGGFADIAALRQQCRHGLWTVIHQPRQLDVVKQARQLPPRFLVKAQTGMHRLGLPPQDVPAAVDFLHRRGADVALMHHFACADEPGGHEAQAKVMRGLVDKCKLPCTAANSAATLLCPAGPGEEFVRCGIALYGASPAYGTGVTAASLGLRPAMSVRGSVMALQEVAIGAGVGYGQRWRALGKARVAVINCGYADGYPRTVTDGTKVHIRGQPASLAGRVSMEMLTVDVTGQRLVVGDEAELWGSGTSVDEVAAAAGTIGYELLASLPATVTRKCVNQAYNDSR